MSGEDDEDRMVLTDTSPVSVRLGRYLAANSEVTEALENLLDEIHYQPVKMVRFAMLLRTLDGLMHRP